jgi:hypothetical protein
VKLKINAGTIEHQVIVEHMDAGTIHLPARAATAATATPAKLLFFAANPATTTALALDEEVRAVETMLRGTELRDRLALVSRWATRPDDLLQQLGEQRPTLVHFSGHGGGDGGLVLQGDDGAERRVAPAAIVTLFASARGAVRTVLFNTCRSLDLAEAVAREVECAIGMDGPIGDAAARTFAAAFYRAVGFGRSVQAAFDQGKAALQLAGSRESGTPRLCTRPDVDATRVILAAGRG